MKHSRYLRNSAGVLLALFGLQANAIPLVTQSPLPGGDSYLSSFDALEQNADNFSLANDATLNSISWWGTATDGSLDGFTVRIFSDTSGEPAIDPLFGFTGSVSQATTGLVDSGGQELFEYALAGTFNLTAGSYWLSVANTGTTDWFWAAGSGGDGLSYFRDVDGSLWTLVEGDFAYSLSGANTPPPPVGVPEPGTLMLFAMGLAWLAIHRRRVGAR